MTDVSQKFGKSNVARMPKKVLMGLNIKVNDEIVIKREEHKTLDKRLSTFYKKPISKIEKLKVEEVDTGDNVGDEIW